MKSSLFALFTFALNIAFAWTVDCGPRTIYYANGNTLVSSGGTVYYNNGNTLISSGGTAYYQSGNIFKSTGDTVYYQNGNTLKSNGGTYYYQNGSIARSSGGTLYLPNGNTTRLPFTIPVDIGESTNALVRVNSSSREGSNIEITIQAGGGQTLTIDVTADGLSCSGLTSEPEFTVTGRSGSAKVKVKSGYNSTKVREAVQTALDSL